MRDYISILSGLILTIYGVISLMTPFINPQKIRWFGDTSDFIYEKLFGKKEFNTFKNIVWGFISLILGILITLFYGRQLLL